MDAEKLISGLIVAAVTGLTYLAYKHPDAFTKVAYPLMGAMFVGWFVLMGHDQGVGDAHSALKPHMVGDERIKSWQTADDAKWLTGRVILGFAAAWGYLWFLAYLPTLLKKKGENGKAE